MSLIVSLRIPDGVVIAGDSLATMMSQLEIAASGSVSCPECKHAFQMQDIKLPPIPVASSTRSFSQKIFPFKKRYGLGSTGMGAVSQKTIYHHIRSLEAQVDEDFGQVDDVATKLGEYFHGELKKQILNLHEAPDDYFPFGLQVVGFSGEEAKTIKVDVGKEPKYTTYTGMGCTVSGETRLVTQVWNMAKEDVRQQVVHANFSLQDAIDYAEFLIRTTATYQRFSNIIPSVGGDIDIALITPYKNFTWIQCKELTEVLEDPV